jgi:glyoxylase-like metal-dependent hydrolase (beta-lactamase superfamily II)
MKSTENSAGCPVEAITDNLYMITLPMPFRLGHVHVFALAQEDRVTLFDTGLNSDESRTSLAEGLAFLGVSLQAIDDVYITHYHADHCGMAGWLQAEYGAKIHISEIDNTFLQKNSTTDHFVNRIRPFYQRHGLPDLTIEHFAKLREHFKRLSPPFIADHYVRFSEDIVCGKRRFRALPAPGHTRGQVCYYFDEEGILLSGDHILPDITPNLSPDLLCPDFYVLSSYLHALKAMQAIEVACVYPGHGAPFPDHRARIDEITVHHDERKSLILDAIREDAKTTYQIAQDIFGLDLPEFDQFLALNETYVHLRQLLREGEIVEEDDRKVARYIAVKK